MSVAAMSATLKKHIADSITKTIQGSAFNIQEKQLVAATSKGGKLVLDTIRSETDAKAESIFSRGGLESLKADMLKYHNDISMDEISVKVIESLQYEGFKDFVLINYYGVENTEGLKGSNLRNDPNFKTSKRLKAVGSRKGTNLEILTATDRTMQYRDVMIFKNINYDKIVEYFTEYMASTIESSDKEKLKKYIKGNLLNAGHLAGAFNARFLRTFGAKKDKTTGKITTNLPNSDELSTLLETTLNLLTSADYLSSNILNDPELFITSEKQLTKTAGNIKVVTEVQLAFLNQEAGSLLKQAGAALTKLIQVASPGVTKKDPEVEKRTKVFYEKLKEVRDYVNKRAVELKNAPNLQAAAKREIDKAIASTKTFDALLDAQGSPSINQHILDIVVQTVTGKKAPTNSASKATVRQSQRKPSTTKKSASKLVVPKKSIKINNPKSTSIQAAETLNLTNLQNLLNQRLHDQIRANMGTGSSKNILNYRQGRFAQSAKVERMSESRQGMITAFLSYMKYPYATFSEGGKQQYPKSRDPKLLLAKQVREIAGTVVSNRMRTVTI